MAATPRMSPSAMTPVPFAASQVQALSPMSPTIPVVSSMLAGPAVVVPQSPVGSMAVSSPFAARRDASSTQRCEQRSRVSATMGGQPTSPLPRSPGFIGPPPPPPKLTEGMPDVQNITEQKDTYAKEIGDNLERESGKLSDQCRIAMDLLRSNAEQKKRQAILAIECQFEQDQLQMNLRYNDEVMKLYEAAQNQRIAVDRRANSLTHEWHAKKSQEDYLQEQYAFQKTQYDEQVKIFAEQQAWVPSPRPPPPHNAPAMPVSAVPAHASVAPSAIQSPCATPMHSCRAVVQRPRANSLPPYRSVFQTPGAAPVSSYGPSLPPAEQGALLMSPAQSSTPASPRGALLMSPAQSCTPASPRGVLNGSYVPQSSSYVPHDGSVTSNAAPQGMPPYPPMVHQQNCTGVPHGLQVVPPPVAAPSAVFRHVRTPRAHTARFSNGQAKILNRPPLPFPR